MRLCAEARETADETLTTLYEHAAETVHLLAEDSRLQQVLMDAGALAALVHVRGVLGATSWLFDALQSTIDYLNPAQEERKGQPRGPKPKRAPRAVIVPDPERSVFRPRRPPRVRKSIAGRQSLLPTAWWGRRRPCMASE